MAFLKLLLLLAASGPLTAQDVNSSSFLCMEDTQEMHANSPALESAASTFWDMINDYCNATTNNVCNATGMDLQPTISIALDFAPLQGQEVYAAFVSACEGLGQGYTVCTIDAEHSSEYITSIATTAQPICVPPSCSMDADAETVLMAHENANCDFDEEDTGDDCELVSTGVSSCSGQNATGNGTCSEEVAAMMQNDLFSVSRFELLSTLDDTCYTETAFAEDSDSCKITVVPVETQFHIDYSSLVNSQNYTDFQSACWGAGGQMCSITLNATLVDAFSIQDVHFKDMPYCFATTCTNASDQELYMKSFLFGTERKEGSDLMRRLVSSMLPSKITEVRNLQEAMDRNFTFSQNFCSFAPVVRARGLSTSGAGIRAFSIPVLAISFVGLIFAF